MSSLPNETFSDITNFLPNDDITDLMLLSRTFNSFVVPRLKKIDQEMTTMNQSIESFMPLPAPAATDHIWITQLNLKRFEPIGSLAKKRIRDAFENKNDIQSCLCLGDDLEDLEFPMLDKLQEIMSLERFDKRSFLRIFCVLIATPEFRQEYNIAHSFAKSTFYTAIALYHIYAHYFRTFDDVSRICSFYNPDCPLFNDITDLMFLSKTFNALVTPRLKKIDQEMATMNQSIESFMPSPEPDLTDNEWISQLNFKRFLPVGSVAKKLMKELFASRQEFDDCFRKFDDCVCKLYVMKPENFMARMELDTGSFMKLKKGMSLERFNDATFLRILGAMVANPKFFEEHNLNAQCLGDKVIRKVIKKRLHRVYFILETKNSESYNDVARICSFYSPYDFRTLIGKQ